MSKDFNEYSPDTDMEERLKARAGSMPGGRIEVRERSDEDTINHPDHYTWHPAAECKDIAGEFPYNVGTSIAYLWRCSHKHPDPIEDLQKAKKHIDFEIERLVRAKGRKVPFA